MRTRDWCHKFWTAPPGHNSPASYVEAPRGRAQYILHMIRSLFPEAITVLECGCNTGRNLATLVENYTVRGIEISPPAVESLRKTYPELEDTHIALGPLEKELPTELPTDVVFTCAVLEHIHPDSGAIFTDMMNIAKLGIITIEDEMANTARHCARNYRALFENLGMLQVFEEIPPSHTGLGTDFRARAFIHE